MKILQVFNARFGISGVPQVVLEITKNVKKSDQVDLLLFTKEIGKSESEFLKYGGKIYRISVKKYNKIIDFINKVLLTPYTIFRIYKVIKNGKYDVVHCHNEYDAGLCLFAAYLAKIKIRIAHFHRANYHFHSNLLYFLYSKIFQRYLLCKFSTNIVFCSLNAKNSFFKVVPKKNHKQINSKTIIALKGIDLNKFDRKRYKKVKSSIYNITNIGQFSDTKNQQFIVNLVPLIIKKNKNIIINLVGFGPNESKLKNLINELNLDNYVKLLPSETDVPELLSRTNLYIHTPIEEGFGIVLLEAQAMEVPCLVSDTVSKEVNLGLIMYKSMNDSRESWIDKIMDILNNKISFDLNKEKLKNFDSSNFVQKIYSIYKGGK